MMVYFLKYETYWSLEDLPSHYIKSSSISLVVFVISIIIFTLSFSKKYRKRPEDKIFLRLFSGPFGMVSLFFTIYLNFFFEDNSKEELQKYISNSQSVEGRIHSFSRSVRRGKYANVISESFFVDSIGFYYGDAFLGRFNSYSKTNNKDLYEGLEVRITYGKTHSIQYNSIYKIEIKK